MAKVLNGADLADFIKVRQAKQVRRLKQADGVSPRLAIVMTEQPEPVIETYVRLKQAYGDDIGVDVLVERCRDDDMPLVIDRLNKDESVHAVVIQLPLADTTRTTDIVNQVAGHKDVDGLGESAKYISATAEAIDWLLAGYDVALEGKKIVLVGRGKLVGGPLERLWHERGLDVEVVDRSTEDITDVVQGAQVIVSAAGQPELIASSMVAPGSVVVDAGTVSEDGKIVGDVADDVRARSDVSMTPVKGGVGPLTVAMMFDHVIRAANATLGQSTK